MQKIILAYATSKGLDQMTREDAQRLTHINLSFGSIRDGLLNLEGLPHLQAQLDRLRSFHPQLKFVLSIGGLGADGFSQLARTEDGRQRFVQSVQHAVADYALDGVDIDWEAPCSPTAGIACDPSDKQNFTLLLRALRKLLPEKILSIAAEGAVSFVQNTEMAQIAQLLDYVQIMTYDLSTSRTQASHHAPLFAYPGGDPLANADACVQLFAKAGVPKEKIVIGAAFYARVWQLDNAENAQPGQSAQGPALYGPTYGQIKNGYIQQHSLSRHWDAQAHAPYLLGKNQFVTYDDPESIAEKCRYVQENGLKGLMYWEHSCDPSGELLGVIADHLGKKA